MATSETALINRALRLLKAGRITSIDDGSKNANVAADVFSGVRETMLRAHTWAFAMRFVQLARLSSTPALGWDYAYALPSDWVRTVQVFDNDSGLGTMHFEEGEQDGVGVLFASTEQVYMKYVYEVTDPNRMPGDFQAAFIYELALAMPGISNISASEETLLARRAARFLNRAKSADGLGSPPRQRPAGSWITSRSGWASSTNFN